MVYLTPLAFVKGLVDENHEYVFDSTRLFLLSSMQQTLSVK
jgi:hypothetical protein